MQDGSATADLRTFLATIGMGMAIAFACGVAFPNDDWVNLKDRRVLHRTNDSVAVPPANDTGQHLWVDTKGIDKNMLEARKLEKMLDELIKNAHFTTLTLDCKTLEDGEDDDDDDDDEEEEEDGDDELDVSCFANLLDSHLSLRAWRNAGVMTLDVLTSKSIPPLRPLVPITQEIFGVESSADIKWSYEVRGFQDDSTNPFHRPCQSDLYEWIMSPIDIISKQEIVSVRTKYQKIHIWDVVEVDATPSHEDAIKANLQPEDDRWTTPEVASPQRLVFVEGVLQSVSSSAHVYHEALVHPSMLAHPHPRLVAMVGTSDGGALREVLKHNTVQSVTVLEQDTMMVEIARQYLPAFSDCSNMDGRSDNCFDDDLVTLVHNVPPQQWFSTLENEEHLDLVVIDINDDPEDGTISSSAGVDLYSSGQFLETVVSAVG